MLDNIQFRLLGPQYLANEAFSGLKEKAGHHAGGHMSLPCELLRCLRKGLPIEFPDKFVWLIATRASYSALSSFFDPRNSPFFFYQQPLFSSCHPRFLSCFSRIKPSLIANFLPSRSVFSAWHIQIRYVEDYADRSRRLCHQVARLALIQTNDHYIRNINHVALIIGISLDNDAPKNL